MPQNERDRVNLSRAPTAVADVFQMPAAAALNAGSTVVNAGLNLGSRVVNAVRGNDNLPTDRVAKQWSLTPFYDEYVRKPEQAALEKAQGAQRAALPRTEGLPSPDVLFSAMQRVESGNNPNAVSPVGATGLMQVMPATAMDPGFGLPNVFDFAAQMGVPVTKRTEKEAKKLLADPAVGAAYGQNYMDAMLQRYNGNLEYALAAYNAGPGRIDKWLAAGADYKKLPKETQDYIPKVFAAMNGTADGQAAPTQGAQPQAAQPLAAPVQVAGMALPPMPQQAAAAQAVPAAETQAEQAPQGDGPVQVEVSGTSEFYRANPQAVTYEMQRAMRQREELSRLAGMYQEAGMGPQFMEARAKLMEMDDSMVYLQGMQGVQDFSFGKDPRRLAAVWSKYAGTPIGIQPRSDGNYDVLVNGRRVKENMDAATVIDTARLSFDAAYRQQKQQASSKYNEEQFKANLETQKEFAKQQAQMIREVTVQQTQGNMDLALERLKQMRYDVKPSNSGDGTVIITPPGGGTPFIYNPAGRTVEVDGVKIKSMDAYPVPGLPTYGGVRTN
jgi:hypothetical protein